MNLNLQIGANQSASPRRIGGSVSFGFAAPSFLHFQRRRGFTLTELMVAAGVGSLVLAAMAMVFITSARSFVTMGNYVEMNSSSRNALDHLTREIRRAGNLTVFSSTPTAAQLQFLKYGTTGTNVVYQWDADSRRLTEWMTGSTVTNVLLTECDELTFTLYKNSFTPTTDMAAAKTIGVSWNSSRTMLGKKTTTEPIQQALIVIRNKR